MSYKERFGSKRNLTNKLFCSHINIKIYAADEPRLEGWKGVSEICPEAAEFTWEHVHIYLIWGS